MPDGKAGYREGVAEAAGSAADTRTLWGNLGRASLLSPLYPPSPEGSPVDPDRLVDLLTELDVRLPVGMVLSVCVQVATVIPVLRAAAGSSPLASQILSETLRGDVIVALAATDARLSGSALLDGQTELRDSADEVVVHGGKEWITNAGHCDYALVIARHSPARHFTSFSWVLVPAHHPGVCCQPVADRLFAGAGLGHFRFDDVHLGKEYVVGRRGRALAEFARHIGSERLTSALWARAMCRRVLADTHRYLRSRSAGEQTLWGNAAVRERFAQCLVELHRVDALCTRHCARSSPAGEGMALKAACAQSVARILGECVDLRGADSFRDDGLSALREQAAMFGIAGGATGAMLAGVAEHADDLLASAP